MDIKSGFLLPARYLVATWTSISPAQPNQRDDTDEERVASDSTRIEAGQRLPLDGFDHRAHVVHNSDIVAGWVIAAVAILTLFFLG